MQSDSMEVFFLEVESEFALDLKKDITVIYQSLLPELEGSHQRTCSQLEIKDTSLILKTRSNDLVSTRAALNGWLRLIRVAVEMTNSIES